MRASNNIMKKLFLGLILLSLVLVGLSKQSQPATALNTLCTSANMSITSTSGTTLPMPISGIVQVNLSNLTTVPTISRVFFFVDGVGVLGRGVQNTANPNYWSMIWDTATLPNVSHTFSADVYYTDNTACTTNPTPIYTFNNPTIRPIAAQVLPVASWTGPTNNNMDFEIAAHVGLNTIDLRQYMIFEWSTTLGSITPLLAPTEYKGHFFSGPVAGTGQVNVLVKYGGAPPVPVNIPVAVVSPIVTTTTTTPTTSPTSTPTGTSSPTPTTQTTTQAPPTNPTLTTKLLVSDPTIRQCLITNIGEARVVAIETELSRPTAAEFDKYQICFAKRSFVVASTLAPVAPTAIKQLKESGDVLIHGAENTKETVQGTEKEKLVFKGKGAPNSTVLIYVFSEPLVLATTTDSSGEWTYTLEDPMAPGSHEAYALVNKGDGTYQRSSPFGFLIGKAEASASNPQGYGLGLQIQPTANANNRSANIFISGIIFIVVFSMTLVIFYLVTRARIKSSKNSNIESTSDTTPPLSGGL